MKCLTCGLDTRVADSRDAEMSLARTDGIVKVHTTWRRRVCPNGHVQATVEVPSRRSVKVRWG